MAFDGIVTKKVVDELSLISGYKIDKIYQPDKNTIILGLYGNFSNLALLACISSNNYRIHLTKHSIKNPESAPNFCMFLRKHILGYKIKSLYSKSLERIVYIELENNENPNKPIYKTLIIELMGKHSNIILVDSSGIILDALRHTSTEDNSQRDIYPTCRYIFPLNTKCNFLDVNDFDDFYKKLSISEDIDIIQKVVNSFNGISFSNLKSMLNSTSDSENTSYMSSKLFAHKIYDKINGILNSNYLCIKYSDNDYYLNYADNSIPLCLNYSLDDFYFDRETKELFKNYRNTLLNLIFSTLKKYEKRLFNIDTKLNECKDMDKFKLYGELITANLYQLPKYNISEASIENYYDNNTLITIPLDKKISPQQNAKRYYKKYNKLKNALVVVQSQKEDTLNEINYIESIIYELENCNDLNDVQQIYDEISENPIFKTSITKKAYNKHSKKSKRMTSNKFASFNPLKYSFDGYTIYVGRNNKENDYLTNKFANKSDLWFHTKDIHGSHVILKTDTHTSVPENIIFEAAKLAALHSKAKNSSNVPVDYCEIKYVKKVSGNRPGLVIYRNNKTIYV